MRIVSSIIFTLIFQNLYGQVSSEYQSYIAHIAAGNYSLRLNEPHDAKYWINNAPDKFRNWEWQYLSHISNTSNASFAFDNDTPTKVYFSPEGDRILVTMTSGLLMIFNTNTLKPITTINAHEGYVYAARFSKNGQYIYSTGRDKTIAKWDGAKGDLIWKVESFGHGLADLDVNLDDNSIAYCSWQRIDDNVNGYIATYDASTGKRTFHRLYDVKPIVSIKYSPNGKKLGIGTWNWKVAVWNKDNLNVDPLVFDYDDVPAYSAIDDFVFSPDGEHVASATKNTTSRVWNINDPVDFMELRGHTKPVFAITYSNDGRYIYTAGGDGVIMVWESSSGKLMNKRFSHTDKINSISMHPSKPFLSSVSNDGTLKIWNMNLGVGFDNKQGRSEYTFAFDISPNGKFLATNGPDNTISIWDANSGELLNNFSGLEESLNAISYNADGSLLIGSNWSKEVRIWDAKTGAIFKDLKGMIDGSPKCAFSADSKLAYVACSDGKLYIWNVSDGKLIKTLDGGKGLDGLGISPDGSFVAVGNCEGEVTVWKTENFTEKFKLKEHSGAIWAIAFSTDGKLLATGGSDGLVKIWNTESGTLHSTLKGHNQVVYDISFLQDNSRIATGSADLSVLIWDVEKAVKVLSLSDATSPIYNIRFNHVNNRLYVNSSGKEFLIYSPQ